MILAGLALALLQAGPAAPSPAAPTGPVRRSEFLTRSAALAYPWTLLPMVAEYRECVYPEGRSPHEPELSLEQAMANRLMECAEVRAREVAKAVDAFPSRQGGQRGRSRRVAAIFDSQDRDFLANARFMDRVIAGDVSLPAAGVPVDLPKVHDAEN